MSARGGRAPFGAPCPDLKHSRALLARKPGDKIRAGRVAARVESKARSAAGTITDRR